MAAEASKRNLLDDSDADSDAGAELVADSFKINEDYARRFEHNKKREERQRLEEKFGDDVDEDDEDSDDDETEDENGFLATEDLDAQISATLQAIKNKDSRVYDKTQTFYKSDDETADVKKDKKEKPFYLRDYQREKLLRGDFGGEDEEEQPITYAQEQESLKKDFLSGVKDAEADSDSDDDAFTFVKNSDDAAVTAVNGVHPARSAKIKNTPHLDVKNADKDPETFLSNFMASRAWVESEGDSKWKAFESDDDDNDADADEFEQAYNMRFEDPEKSKEVLRSYARDVTNSRSVRRDQVTGRRRQRELEKERRAAEKKERGDERARLRKLKLEEAEEKLRKIKHAAGAVGRKLTDSEWVSFMDSAWEDENWEEEMQKRFGDDYYAMQDDAAGSDDEEGGVPLSSKKRKPKKPTWDDDIDINDIVPDFDDEAAGAKFALSDAEDAGEEEEETKAPIKKKRKTADIKKDRMATQKKTRAERAQLEALVDARMDLSEHALVRDAGQVAARAAADATSVQPFRYRATSPQSFGMTARDILLAPSDGALNEFAGLKKLAPFRDAELKRRDRKRFGKKARLRQWRRDVFGRDYERTGPTYGFERLAAEDGGGGGGGGVADEKTVVGDEGAGSRLVGNIIEAEAGQAAGKKRKRKRSKGQKAVTAE